jgi:hypothetical protein
MQREGAEMHLGGTYHLAQLTHLERERAMSRRPRHATTGGRSQPMLVRQRRLAVAALTLALTLSIGTAMAGATPIPSEPPTGNQFPL